MDFEFLEKLEHSIDKINALSEAAAERTLWRPIKTAPRDGTNILGCKNGIKAVVRWLVVEKIWAFCVPGEFIIYHDWKPTLWMPLPPGPKDS